MASPRIGFTVLFPPPTTPSKFCGQEEEPGFFGKLWLTARHLSNHHEKKKQSPCRTHCRQATTPQWAAICCQRHRLVVATGLSGRSRHPSNALTKSSCPTPAAKLLGLPGPGDCPTFAGQELPFGAALWRCIWPSLEFFVAALRG